MQEPAVLGSISSTQQLNRAFREYLRFLGTSGTGNEEPQVAQHPSGARNSDGTV